MQLVLLLALVRRRNRAEDFALGRSVNVSQVKRERW
jgi:hypothetical protein